MTQGRTAQRFQNLFGAQSVNVLHVDALLWVPEKLLLVSLGHISNWLPCCPFLIGLVLFQSYLLRLASCNLSCGLYLAHSKLDDGLLSGVEPILFREQAAGDCVSEPRAGFVFSAINLLLSTETICYEEIHLGIALIHPILEVLAFDLVHA